MSEAKPSAAQILRQARLDREWTLEQVSTQTRIPKEQIQALEESNWGVLPGAPYARAFCKTLAQAYELDPELVLAGLRNDMGLTPTEPKSTKPHPPIAVATPSEDGPQKRAPWIMAGMLLLALLLVLAATRIGNLGGMVHSPTDTLKAPTDSGIDSVIDTAIATAAPPPRTAPPQPSKPSTPVVHLSAMDTGNAVFVLYIRQGINKVRKKTLGLGDTLSFDPDTSILIHSVSHRPLRLGGAFQKDSINTACFRVERKSDTVRFSPVGEDEWQKLAGAIKRLKHRTSE